MFVFGCFLGSLCFSMQSFNADPSKVASRNWQEVLSAEASLAFRSKVGSPQQPTSNAGRNPCLRQKTCVNCYKLKDPGVASLFPGICTFSLQAKTFNLLPDAPRSFTSHSLCQLQEKIQQPRNYRKIEAAAYEDNGVPTLMPVQEAHEQKPRKRKVAAIIGGAVAALLVVFVVVLVYICLMRVRKYIRRTSDTASSVPSLPAELEIGSISPYACPLSPFDSQNLRQLTIQELKRATCDFSQNNILGEGRFGFTYKGLLQDGSIVAIKRRLYSATQYFFHEVKNIARVNHMHLVSLIGYYQDAHQQLLVYDYLSNRNIGNHLYDSEGLPIGKLGIRQRLSVALGAARGLEHLHSLVPPLLHMHFRTSNVLVDDNFMAKVSDYGLTKFVIEGNHAGSSSSIDCFLDPELDIPKKFSERSDVYSFGVFLLELISGREAHGRYQSNSVGNLVLQAKNRMEFENFVDKSLEGHTMYAAKQMMGLAMICIDASVRRPTMKFVLEELERIQESEVDVQIGAVTLGSELFK
ncbi:probable serine/threonine-protein kinase PBL28 isoform X2 [Ziziphus jujuba]|uniref:non-specific serine/threonine protein kinase n=1 Tax=Ziziphus jujuba TaxID=326968 RepID=A0A6P6FVU8_ZIZJJ|nr:probable serine/threonine-protein kinase PBL28 isoform X2 [Ziziphus jujuba]